MEARQVQDHIEEIAVLEGEAPARLNINQLEEIQDIYVQIHEMEVQGMNQTHQTRSNIPAQSSSTEVETRPSLPPAINIKALKQHIKFNIALISIMIAFDIFSTRREENDNCHVSQSQPLLMAIEMLSFGLLCFSSGLATRTEQKMGFYREMGNEEAERSQWMQILIRATSVFSSLGMLCLLGALLLRMELKAETFTCQNL